MVARPTRKRMYRTMQGRMVDIEKLRAANESVRAIGNMNVNARGDILGPSGQVAVPKEKVIAKYYEQPRGRVDDTPTKARTVRRVAQSKPVVQKMTPVASKPTPQPAASKPDAPAVVTPEKKGIDAALDGLE